MTTEQNATELRSCPFCGSQADFKTNGYATWVACSKCQCTGEEGSREEAISAWNKRAQQPTPVPAGQVPAIVHDALLRAYSALVSCSIKENSDFRKDQFYFNEVKVRDAMQAIKPILDATPAAPQPE